MSQSLSTLIGDSLHLGTISFRAGGEAFNTAELGSTGFRLFHPRASEPAVATLLTNDRASVELVLGAVVAGAKLVSLPIPSRHTEGEAYLNFLRETCVAQGVSSLIVRDDIAPLLASSGMRIVPHSQLGERPLAQCNPGGFELIQFSSGSTGRPKGIGLSDDLLGRNVAAMIEVIGPRPGDVAVSWLPLSHDMGLIGMLLTSVVSFGPRFVNGGELLLLEPEAFLRWPQGWLHLLDERRGTITASPDFGLRMALRYPPTASVDLSSLRCVIVGGEIVRAETLTEMCDTFAPAGLDPVALCPAYGMAELGLAASMTRPEHHWLDEHLDLVALANGECRPPAKGRAVRLATSGPPLTGYAIRGSSDAGQIGPLIVDSPAVGWDANTGDTFAAPDGQLHTGDRGYITDDGHVVVVGRSDDYIIANGRNLYAPEIEAVVSRIAGVRAGRVAIVSAPTGEWMVAVEPSTDGATYDSSGPRLRRAIRQEIIGVADAAPDEIRVVERGRIPTTPSGKLRRGRLLEAWLQGDLDVESL